MIGTKIYAKKTNVIVNQRKSGHRKLGAHSRENQTCYRNLPYEKKFHLKKVDSTCEKNISKFHVNRTWGFGVINVLILG